MICIAICRELTSAATGLVLSCLTPIKEVSLLILVDPNAV